MLLKTQTKKKSIEISKIRDKENHQSLFLVKKFEQLILKEFSVKEIQQTGLTIF